MLFFNFLKKTNKQTRICLKYGDAVSDQFKDDIEEIVDEIIATTLFEYKPPYLTFPELEGAKKRDELLEYLKYKQQTRSTFDGRLDSQVEPIGFIDGKPIWPRVIEKVKSPARLFFDDDNFAYQTGDSNIVDMIHEMDKAENYKRVIKFLEKYTS